MKCQTACVCLAIGLLMPYVRATDAASVVPEPSVIRLDSASGRFVVLGPKPVRYMGLTQWAEELAERVEGVTGIRLAPCSGCVRIRVQIEGEPKVGQITLESGRIHGRLAQRLTLVNPEVISGEEARLVLCQAILRLMVEACLQAHRDGDHAEPAETPVNIPSWLLSGVARNLFPEQRARNRDRVVDRWQKGRLPPLVSFVGEHSGPAPDASVILDDPDRFVSGLFIDWLAEQGPESGWFAGVAARLGTDALSSPVWLVDLVNGCRTVSDLEDRWDAWLLEQRYVVHRPGTTTRVAFERLTEALLLYPADFDMPLTGNLYRSARIHDLADVREAPWLDRVVGRKADELRIIAVGRGDDLREVVDAYCAYLESITAPRCGGEAKALLRKADRTYRTLRYRLESKERGAHALGQKDE